MNPAQLAKHLSTPTGSKQRFGATAADVLENGALIAAADQAWSKEEIAAFQEQQDLHPKVWDKLIAIQKDYRLKPLRELLPASYTALYALVVMNDEELEAAKAEGVIRPQASSRSILDWTKAFRLRGTGIEREVPLTLVLKEDLTSEQQSKLLAALRSVAESFDVEVLEGKSGVRHADVKAEQRRALAGSIEEELRTLLAPVVERAPETLKNQFGVSSADDLIQGTREPFTGFLQLLENKVQGAFWRQYGRVYALKIAYDFNLTDSRAERYQLKDRLKKAQERWAPQIEGFEEMLLEVSATYMRN